MIKKVWISIPLNRSVLIDICADEQFSDEKQFLIVQIQSL